MGRSADIPRKPTTGNQADDAGCSILHVDMDAFFASVEIRRRPELRGQPVIVGGGVRGVVSAASYEARLFGVRSAMPMSQARRLCPQAVVITPDRGAYVAASGQVMAILGEFSPVVEPLSLDEAFLDVAAAARRVGSPSHIAQLIRAQVLHNTGLTCSVGVAPTKFVAKLASATCKPDGMLVVPVAGVLSFLHPLPVTALWGVGARTAGSLHRLGIRTVADLAATPAQTLRRSVGTAMADHLLELASGRDCRSVVERGREQSISADHTFDADLTRLAEVEVQMLRISEEVGARVRARGLSARTVGIKIRFADFTTVTRVRTLAAPVDASAAIHAEALALLQAMKLDRPRIRLVGIKCENLVATSHVSEQLSLDFTSSDPAQASGGAAATAAPSTEVSRRVERVADQVAARFGRTMLTRASLLPTRPTEVNHGKEHDGTG